MLVYAYGLRVLLWPIFDCCQVTHLGHPKVVRAEQSTRKTKLLNCDFGVIFFNINKCFNSTVACIRANVCYQKIKYVVCVLFFSLLCFQTLRTETNVKSTSLSQFKSWNSDQKLWGYFSTFFLWAECHCFSLFLSFSVSLFDLSRSSQ